MSNKLYGAILGDLAGQPYEYPALKHFPNQDDIDIHNPNSKITDDTLMTLAVAKSIIECTRVDYEMRDMGRRYPGKYYGKRFIEWINSDIGTFGNSYGNGCIMRISPFMYLSGNENEIRSAIITSCVASHNDPVSINACLDLYDLYHSKSLLFPIVPNVIDKFEEFKIRADDTITFIKSLHNTYNSTHHSIIKAVSCGGDTDTNASIIGELMNFEFNDLTDKDIEYVESKLDPYLLEILKTFNEKFDI
jgi:ADP-ribosylglycohydrolase